VFARFARSRYYTHHENIPYRSTYPTAPASLQAPKSLRLLDRFKRSRQSRDTAGALSLRFWGKNTLASSSAYGGRRQHFLRKRWRFAVFN